MTQTTRTIRIWTIHHRYIRYLLIFERVAFPIGLGLSFGELFAILFSPLSHWWNFVLVVLGIIYMIIGLLRPVHRQLKIKFNDFIEAPNKLDD
jgi:hypothetical protein